MEKCTLQGSNLHSMEWVPEMDWPKKLQLEGIIIITQGWNSLWFGSDVQGGKNGIKTKLSGKKTHEPDSDLGMEII